MALNIVVVSGNTRTIVLESFRTVDAVVAWMLRDAAERFGENAVVCRRSTRNVWYIQVGARVCATTWYEVSID